jgi:hypothetical protein
LQRDSLQVGGELFVYLTGQVGNQAVFSSHVEKCQNSYTSN